MKKKVLLLFFMLFMGASSHAQVTKSDNAVRNLKAEAGEGNVRLSWEIPEGWSVLSWSDMNVEDYGGIGAGQCAADIAHFFSIDDLLPYVGWQIESVSVVLNPSDTIDNHNGIADYRVRVWKEDSGVLSMVCDQKIDSVIFNGRPQVITLNNMVDIEAGMSMWIGLYIDRYLIYPWAYDKGPEAPEGKGLRFRLYHNQEEGCVPEEWKSMPGMPFNFCISATVKKLEYDNVSLSKEEVGLKGYRVYRNGQMISEIPYPFQTSYIDDSMARESDLEYCVTAVYGENESASECTIVQLLSVEDDAAVTGFKISVTPNPTNGSVSINGVDVVKVEVYNAVGQLVMTVGNTRNVDLSRQGRGVYTLKVIDLEGQMHFTKVLKE